MQLVYVHLPRYLRFNRYMVECECDYICTFTTDKDGFNRYMVECE